MLSSDMIDDMSDHNSLPFSYRSPAAALAQLDQLMVEFTALDTPAEVTQAKSAMPSGYFVTMYPEYTVSRLYLSSLLQAVEQTILNAESEVPTTAAEQHSHYWKVFTSKGVQVLADEGKKASVALSALLQTEKSYREMLGGPEKYYNRSGLQSLGQHNDDVANSVANPVNQFLLDHSDFLVLKNNGDTIRSVAQSMASIARCLIHADRGNRWTLAVNMRLQLEFLSSVHEGQRKEILSQMLQIVKEYNQKVRKPKLKRFSGIMGL